MNTQPTTILLLCDSPADSELLTRVLADEVPTVVASWDPMAVAVHFERCLPDVLLLACRQLEQNQSRSAALYRDSEIAPRHPHRTLVLCHTDEASQTYALCKNGTFDDYATFWPEPSDAHQLPMNVLNALQQLRAARVLQSVAAELVECADRNAAAELLLTPLGAEPADAVQVLQRRMNSMVKPGPTDQPGAAPPNRRFASLTSSVDRLEALAASSSELRKKTESHLDVIRTLRDRSQAKSPKNRVLIVEDDDFQQQMLSMLLQQENLAFDSAFTVKDAMTALEQHTPSLILLDYHLPDADGISFLLNVRQNPAWSKVPVIMLTGNSDRQIVVTSLQAGANDFIVKPVNPIVLREKIRRYTAAAA